MYEKNFNKNQKVKVFVGYFFIIALIFFLIFSFFYIFKVKWFFLINEYVVYYKYGNDIRPGALVTINGIEVGEVKKIDINDDNLIEVRLSVHKKYGDKIREDSVAKIIRPLLIGNKQINISPGSKNKKILKPNSELISEESSELIDLVSGTSLQDMVSELGLDKDLDEFFENENLSVREIYDNAIAALLSMNELQQSMGKLGDSLTVFSDTMGEMSGSIEDMGESMKGFETLGNSMSGLSDNMGEFAKSFSEFDLGFSEDFGALNEKIMPMIDEVMILILAFQKNALVKKEVKKMKADLEK